MGLLRKQISKICQLSRPDIYEVISQGIALCLENAIQLDSSAKAISDLGYPHESNIISYYVEEEAAKCLLLLDAIRAPAGDQCCGFVRRNFYNHKSKAMYTWSVMGQYSSFEEFQIMVNDFLDDTWVEYDEGGKQEYPSPIIFAREDDIYVDLLSSDDKYRWSVPRKHTFGYYQKQILILAKALFDVGLTSPAALDLLHNLWIDFPLEPKTTKAELDLYIVTVLQELENKKLLKDNWESQVDPIVKYWPFPLHSIDRVGER